MELHPTRELELGKVLHCKDCGARLFLAKNSLSVTCDVCGNIAFLGKDTRELKKSELRGETIISRRLISQLVHALPVVELESKAGPIDGLQVEELIFRYQVEWQLWSALVENFQDPNYHMAYVSLISQCLDFSAGIKRYQTHSKVMAKLSDSRWQSEVCDRQMELLQQLSMMQFERELQRPNKRYKLPRSLGLVLSFTAGLIFVVHFFAR